MCDSPLRYVEFVFHDSDVFVREVVVALEQMEHVALTETQLKLIGVKLGALFQYHVGIHQQDIIRVCVASIGRVFTSV